MAEKPNQQTRLEIAEGLLEQIGRQFDALTLRVAALEQKPPPSSGRKLSSVLWEINQKIEARKDRRATLWGKYRSTFEDHPEEHAEYVKLLKEIKALEREKSEL